MAVRILHGRARQVAGALGLSMALGLAAAPALATTTQREHFAGTDAFSYNDCGFSVNVAVTFSGHSVLRIDKSGQAFLVKGTSTFREVHTNPQTGEFFVLRGRSTFNELRATHVEGDIYQFDVVEAGQPFVVEDSDGNVVVRDRGAIRFSYLFDTLGDNTPGGNFVADVGTPSVHGPHEGFGEDFDFCGMVEDLIG